MGLIKRLFARNRVTARELKLALRQAERESRRKEEAIHHLDEKQESIFEKVKTARRAGRAFEVDSAWEGLRQIKAELAIERRQHKVMHLEVIVLKRTVWSLERLESRKSRIGIDQLLSKFRASGLDDKLLGESIREEEYIRELDEILRDASIESEGQGGGGRDFDPEKSTFLAELDAIIAAEDSGDDERAHERQSHLRERIRNEENKS